MALPPAELWSKFQSAIVWVRGILEAGVAVVQRAPAGQPEKLLVSASTGTTSAPSGASAGALVEGYRTINLYVFGSGTYTATLALYVYNGARWLPLTTVDVSQADGALDPLDIEGYTRIAAQVTAHTGAAHSLGVFPYHVEA